MPELNKPEIKTEIVKKYIPLVKYIASRVIIGKNKYIEFEDLISYGMIGLIDAINKFDSSKNLKFSTYASIRIKGSMIDEIRKISPISKTAADKLNKYNDVVEELQKKLLREPTYEEVCNKMGITVNEICEIENNINYISMVSLEGMIFSDDNDVKVINTIVDRNSPSPEKVLEEKEKIEYLTRAIDNLNEKDRTVLSLYYYDRLTLKQIGKVFEISESRVCQLHSRAIMHLKNEMKRLKYNIKDT